MSIEKPVDQSLERQLPFHPCLTPRGMPWYDLTVLTANQQRELNELKVNIVRENNKYLAQHPEIRAIVAIFSRAVMKEKSLLVSPAEYASLYFDQPKELLQAVIDKYLRERGEPLDKEGDSAMNVFVGEGSKSSSSSASQSRYFSYDTFTDQLSLEYFHDWYSDHEGASFHSTQTTSKTLEYLACMPQFDGESLSGYDDSIDMGFFDLVKKIQDITIYEDDEDNAAQFIRGMIYDAVYFAGEDMGDNVPIGDEVLGGEMYGDEILGEVEIEGHIEPPVTQEPSMIITQDADVTDNATAELADATIEIVKSVLDAGT